MENPYYLVTIKSFVCNVDVFLNGAPVYREVKGMPAQVTLPVNDAVFNGLNRLNIKITSRDGIPFDYETKARVEVVLTNDNHADGRITVAQWQAPPYGEEENPAVMADSADLVFKADQPYEPASWASAQTIDLTDAALLQRFVSALQLVHRAFQTKNLSQIIEFFNFRNDEFTERLYLDPEARQNELEQSLELSLNSPELSLLNYDLNYLQPKIYGEGKLFTLEDEEGYPGIMLVDLQTPSFTAFPVYLSIDEKGAIFISK